MAGKKPTREKISLKKDIIQTGDIRVSSQIVDDLSSGIYSSPASCVKELVNNSFDADANLVTIRLKPIEETIAVIDDGVGMNAKDFDENFAWISKSNKRNSGEFSPKGRPLIGKIGIGFIAVNEICNQFEIISTKKGENIKFTAKIDFTKITKSTDDIDNGVIKASYELINTEEDKDTHYTIINLFGIKKETQEILRGQQYHAQMVAEKSNKKQTKTTFANMEEVLDLNSSLRSYSGTNKYTQFIIDLASYLPVEYIEGAPIEGAKDRILTEIIEKHKNFKFKVDLDGIYLKKPIFFRKKDGRDFVVKTFSEKIKTESGELVFKGYMYAQHGIIFPRETAGLAVRVKNIPIANRYGFDNTFMGYPAYINQLFMNWISGEVYVERGLEDAMNIDRQSFRETHPHYIALQNYIHEYITDYFLPKVVMPIYTSNKEVRDKAKEKTDNTKLKAILNTNKVSWKTSETSTTKSMPVRVLSENKKTTIEVNKDYFRKLSKKDAETAQNMALIFETSLKESRGDMQKLRIIFYEKMQSWFMKKK